MPTFLEARQRVLDRAALLKPVHLPLSHALGRAVAADLRATEPVPPFTNSAMDGFAVRHEDLHPGLRLAVAGDLPAGAVPIQTLSPGKAIRIMTGAAIPAGADTVVPVEHTHFGTDWVEIQHIPRLGANIRTVGEDIPAGSLVVAAGTALRPSEIAVLAATGFASVPVHPKARVAVLTTGDELVDCSQNPGSGQIRDANLHALCAQIESFGAEAVSFARIPDRCEAVDAALREALSRCDVVLTTGGVSVGDYDFVKPAIESLGAEQVFWRVDQKPGAPLGFWVLDGKPIFGLPGNPVAAMLMTEEYVRPALRRMMGFRLLRRPVRLGTMESAWRKREDDARVHFLRVTVREEEGILRTTPTGPQGSGILSSMLKANALAILWEHEYELPAGSPVTLHLTDLPEDH